MSTSKEFNQSEILQMYNSGNDKIKSLLIEKFGKDFFEPKIPDRVKSFEDACKEKGIIPESILPYSSPANDMQEGLNAYAKMFLIAEVLNDGWEPDWNNSSEYKYYPWFDMRTSSGSRFSFGDFGWLEYAYVCRFSPLL